MRSEQFWIRAVIESDMGPRLRFVLEFVCAAGVLLTVTVIGARAGLAMMDRTMVAESASLTFNSRADAVIAYAQTGRWPLDDDDATIGSYSSARWDADGYSVVTLSDQFGSPGLRGREVIWALKQSSPWTSNVLSWSCQSADPNDNGVAYASLPEFCKE